VDCVHEGLPGKVRKLFALRFFSSDESDNDKQVGLFQSCLAEVSQGMTLARHQDFPQLPE